MQLPAGFPLELVSASTKLKFIYRRKLNDLNLSDDFGVEFSVLSPILAFMNF